MTTPTALLMMLALLIALPANAALQWENTVIEIEPAPLAEQAVGIFHFTNTGTTPVTITDTHASCGCTTPTLDQRVYAPGESGELRAVYAFGEATGHQEKTVTVSTTEPAEKSYVLTLRVTIPELFEVQPRFVMWRQNESPATKTISIRALHPDLAEPVAAEGRDPRFTVELKKSADTPGLFTIAITPQSTAAPIFTSVTVSTSAPAEKKRVIQVFATVR